MNRTLITEEQFAEYCESIPDVFFIQIGANDGISFDPIHHLIMKHNWKGVLIEPGKVAFDQLRETYKDRKNDLVFLNYAVSNYDGEISLYCGSTTPHFTVDFLKAKHMFDVEPKEFSVPCISMSTLVQQYVKVKLDVLQIDAEGHDHIILENFDFNAFTPKIIRFEHVSIEELALKKCLTTMLDFGYNIMYSTDGADIIAIKEK
jgi:FkbM family methyltransferase